MRREYTISPHNGLRCLRRQPGYLYLDQATPPTCEKHGVDLEPVRDFDQLALKSESEVLACPWCFCDGSNGIDTTEVTKVIGEQWVDYSKHFEEQSPPEVDTVSPTFEVR